MEIKKKLYIIIFESDTKAGKAFDVVLLWAILISIAAVMLESVESIEKTAGSYLRAVELMFSAVFLIEYILRIYSSEKRFGYIFSFFGIIDFLSVIPGFFSLTAARPRFLIVVRSLRMLRVFRIFKLGRYMKEGVFLLKALKASRYKITIFLGAVCTILIIVGTLMYLIEGAENGYTSIPRSIYWAVVTLTTVGYGDIAPRTITGQTLASFIMILGYAIIAVPTGIITAELSVSRDTDNKGIKCRKCSYITDDEEAIYCKKCGFKIRPGFKKMVK
ncbi:MAG: ion transporter [Spirochaetes bacterium]|nr:ion transporter [Spirochaetota bacterium]